MIEEENWKWLKPVLGNFRFFPRKDNGTKGKQSTRETQRGEWSKGDDNREVVKIYSREERRTWRRASRKWMGGSAGVGRWA